MGYSLTQLNSDNQTFKDHYWNEIQSAQNDFKNSMADLENMSEDDAAELVANYVSAELNAKANAADYIALHSSDPTEVAFWQSIAEMVREKLNSLPQNLTWSEIKQWLHDELGWFRGQDPDFQAEMADRVEHLGNGINEISSLTPISPAGRVPFCTEVVLSNTLPDWDYGYDTSQTPKYDKWWYRYKWFPKVDPETSDDFNSSRNWFFRSDPLVIDLDGDGIETVGPSANIMFDHDGDGTLNGKVK